MNRPLFSTVLTGQILYILILSLLTCGCAAPRHAGIDAAFLKNAESVRSLSSNAGLSFSSPRQSLSGSGVIMFNKPDQLRVVVLSPFGTVIQEVFVSGDMISIIDAGNGIAFSGTLSELPGSGDVSGWRHIKWLTDIDPPNENAESVTVERVNRFGGMEQAVFENGLLAAKTSASAGRVIYRDYARVGGAVLPMNIAYETDHGERFSIVFEDPDVNPVFDNEAFTPKFTGLRVYPLSMLK